jgi:hypothetical protein
MDTTNPTRSTALGALAEEAVVPEHATRTPRPRPSTLPGNSAADDLVEGGDGGVGVDGVVDDIGQGLPAELVDDVEDLDHPAGGGDVELVVEGPHVVGTEGLEAIGRCGRFAHPPALPTLGRHPQTLLTPQTLDLLAIQAVALTDEHGVGPAVAPSRMGLGEGPQQPPQLGVWIGLGGSVALG